MELLTTFYNDKPSKLMPFLCIFVALFCTTTNACFYSYDCLYPEEKCCREFDPPKCISSSSSKCTVQTTRRPTTPSTTATELTDDYNFDYNDDDDGDLPSMLIPAIIGILFVGSMCWIGAMVSKRRPPAEPIQLQQQRNRATDLARFTNVVQGVQQSSRRSSDNDVTIHLVAPMRPTAPDLRRTVPDPRPTVPDPRPTAPADLSQISRQSDNPNSNLLSNFDEVQPERFRDAPPMYTDVVGTDSLPPPPKYEDVV